MSTDKQTIINQIRAYILEEHFSDAAEDLKNDMPLISSGIIDSISVLQLVDFLEETFGIEFEPHEVDHSNMNSIDLMVAFVQSKIG